MQKIGSGWDGIRDIAKPRENVLGGMHILHCILLSETEIITLS